MLPLALSLHKKGHFATFYHGNKEIKVALSGGDWHAEDGERCIQEVKKQFPNLAFEWKGSIRYPRQKDHVPLGNPLEDGSHIFHHFDLGWQALRVLADEPCYVLWTDDWTYALGSVLPDLANFQPMDGQYPIWWQNNTHQVACLFSGNEQERQIQHLARHFGVPEEQLWNMPYLLSVVRRLRERFPQVIPTQASTDFLMDCPFVERSLNQFRSVEEAYHQFMLDLVAQQAAAWSKVERFKTGAKILVGGKLAQSPHFMNGLAEAFFGQEVYAVLDVSLPEWALLKPSDIQPTLLRFR